MAKYLKYFYLFVAFCFVTKGQVIYNQTCKTLEQKNGLCISIKDCPSLLKLLLTQRDDSQVRHFLKASVCGPVRRIPTVCCVQREERGIQNVTTRSDDIVQLPKSPNCGFSNVTVGRIVNGITAKLGEFPWLVALGYRNPKNPELPQWHCGGSLITNKHVLTAAHCAYDHRDLYLVRLGDLDLYSDDDGATTSTIEIAKVKIHDNFSMEDFINDIAILTLKESTNNPTVRPICLPVVDPYRYMDYLNSYTNLAGWGATAFRGPSSSTLQQIMLTVLSNDVCKKFFGPFAIIDEKIICAQSPNGDQDACGGDSGGPLMVMIPESKHYRVYQIGIVSYGFKCAEPDYPGVYTRVTTHIDWIQKNLN